MSRKYFGTDGIRGKANSYPMTARMAMRVAMATALALKGQQSSGHQNKAVIGKDTRLSCYMLEQAMAAGFEAMGMDVIFLGPIPTPAVAMLTRSLRADVGVMISASHNPYQDNGIKLFSADGFKLPDSVEEKIESYLEDDMSQWFSEPDSLGRASRLDDASGRYVEFVKSTFPRKLSLEGLKVVVDCAHGAAYKVAPQVLWELEAQVIAEGIQPNGKNINLECGATHTKLLQNKVLEHQADIGIALDGDADRLIVVDEKGRVIDGDQIMALLATEWAVKDRLHQGTLVSTVMSNLGLERYLLGHDLKLERTAVGDRYVVEKMRDGGFNLGGEQSGHIVFSDFGTTGDGLVAALQILSIVKSKDTAASNVLNMFKPLPQILRNVKFNQGKPLENTNVIKAIQTAEQSLVNKGRLLVRLSGTEPLVRVMAEGDNESEVESIVGELCSVIEDAAKSA
jgi:phosphoglucosamine mutase